MDEMIAALVRRHDPDRFLTALFAPSAKRDVLLTLYAFNHELARAREVVSEPLLARIWARAQDLVTVRQGDRVLLGDPAAGVLGRARTALDAGDLAGAVAAVATLTGPAAQAMAGWLADARSLLDARAALADRAAHS